MKPPTLTAEIVTLNAPVVSKLPGGGWGDEAEKTLVTGEVAQISILKDGKLEFSIRILPTGRLIFTDYQNRCYQPEPIRNLSLEPARNWNDKP